MMSLTDRFLERIFSIRRIDYSKNVETLVRTYLTDTVGVTLAGAVDLFEKEEALLFVRCFVY